MTKNLLIVESPAKAKTIERYLGPDFRVMASYGHIQELVPKDGAVDTDADYMIKYQVIPERTKQLNAIIRALKDADALYLATDPDREGEAISWLLCSLLSERGKLGDRPVRRIVFHEITQEAVTDALEHPRDLDSSLVAAFHSRKAIDYLVGFNLSPLLWRKIAPKLSAGRVQSPALRMLVEREDEIEKFEPREYWSVAATLRHQEREFAARLYALEGTRLKKFDLGDEKSAQDARARVEDASARLVVRDVVRKQRSRKPAPPFTTSTLQQEASRKLYFSARKTMRTAQQLYEGVDLGGGEAAGLISYMRTDSVTLAETALVDLRETIAAKYGKEMLPEEPCRYRTKTRNAQEAHEAIRPTDAARTPDSLRGILNDDQQKLYDLIWKRTVACQMIPAVLDQVTATIVDAEDAGAFELRATGSHVRVPGFMAVYIEDTENVASDERFLPDMRADDVPQFGKVEANQHFTEPPPRYTEASLVKALEEYGIGRPSTYAAILSTLVSREYALLEGRTFFPTLLGRAVSRFLSEHFTQYVDYEFTANMETSLDEVANGEAERAPLVDGFWKPFHEQLNKKAETISRKDAQMTRELGDDPKTGKPVILRVGRYGPFVQLGQGSDEEKPKFASLQKEQKFDTITLEEALDLLKLPRELGTGDDGEPIEVNRGRYGPYVRYGKKRYVSLADGEDPLAVTLERAHELIVEHKKKEASRDIQDFGSEGIRVLNGRYGPYITDGTKNAKVPKDRDPKELTLEECKLCLEKAPARKRKKGAGASRARSRK